MSNDCDVARLSLGAYALGTLEPADAHLVQAHLASCSTCITELSELETVLPALATLSPEDATARAPSADLFARIASAVDAVDAAEASPPTVAHRYHSPRWLIAIAASVVVLAGAGTAVGIAISTSSPHHSTTVATATASGIRLQVAATDAASGTRLQLTATGLPHHEHCHLIALAADGSRHDAGRWDADYGGQARVTEATDIARSQLRRLTLYGDHNQQLVTLTL